jgi:hypothetical protein
MTGLYRYPQVECVEMGETGETHLFVKSSICLKASLKTCYTFSTFPSRRLATRRFGFGSPTAPRCPRRRRRPTADTVAGAVAVDWVVEFVAVGNPVVAVVAAALKTVVAVVAVALTSVVAAAALKSSVAPVVGNAVASFARSRSG